MGLAPGRGKEADMPRSSLGGESGPDLQLRTMVSTLDCPRLDFIGSGFTKESFLILRKPEHTDPGFWSRKPTWQSPALPWAREPWEVPHKCWGAGCCDEFH